MYKYLMSLSLQLGTNSLMAYLYLTFDSHGQNDHLFR